MDALARRGSHAAHAHTCLCIARISTAKGRLSSRIDGAFLGYLVARCFLSDRARMVNSMYLFYFALFAQIVPLQIVLGMGARRDV